MNHARSGSYVQQLEGYRAFIPKSLSPDPPVRMDDEMLAMLSAADQKLGRLDGSIQTLPDPDLFVYMYLRKEAVLSSQIEGTQSSLNDILEAEAEISRPHHPTDIVETINYVDAMRYGLERLEQLPLSVRLIREIHERLLSGLRGDELQPGELSRRQNWIGPADGTLQQAIFVPPPPSEVSSALGALERFIHQKDKMPALIEIGLMHAQFETIHPFLDGNGRVGRMLITFLLCERKILTEPVLYLSFYFKRHRDRYYDLLQRVRDEGDWESWLRFFLTAVAEVATEATLTARHIVDLRERHRAVITHQFGLTAANALNVLESLYSRPLITVSRVAKLTRMTFPPANDLVARFVEHGILHEITGQARNRVFRYSDYIGIFSEE